LGPFCFARCGSLQRVTFGFPSKSQSIPAGIFELCGLLTVIYIPSSLRTVFSESFASLSQPWPMRDESVLQRFLAGIGSFRQGSPVDSPQNQVMCLASSENGWSKPVCEVPTVKHKNVSIDADAVAGGDEFCAGYWQAWEDLATSAHFVLERNPKPRDVKAALICPRFAAPAVKR
jgi:hypothetical protein